MIMSTAYVYATAVVLTLFCTLLVCRWFYSLCDHFGVYGQAYYFFKLHGKGRTVGVKPGKALADLKAGLRDPSMSFIYHCYNHYFCTIGFEEVPKKAKDAYK